MFGKRKYHPSTFTNTIGVIVLVATIVMVLFGGASGITKENIENALSRFAQYISSSAAERDKEAKFTYGDVSIEGWGRGKEGVVNNVSLEIAEKALLDTTKWSFSTTRVKVVPDSVAYNGLYFNFYQPINVIQNSQLKMTISSPQPFRYGYAETKQDGHVVVNHIIKLPSQIIFTQIKGVGDNTASNSRTIITFDPNPLLRATYYPDSHNENMQYHFHNIHTVSDEGRDISIEDLAGQYEESRTDDRIFHGKYNWQVNNFVVSDGAKSIPPYSLKFGLSYSGDEPAMNIRALLPSLGGSSELAIDSFLLTGPDFTISAKGHIASALDDPLPFGAMDVEITNAGNMVNSALIPDSARSSVNAALEKITGHPVDAQTHIIIPVKRDKNGVSYIGAMSFEELTAVILHSAFLSTQKPQTPELPPAGTPAEPAIPAVPVAPPAPPAPAAPGSNGGHAGLIEDTTTSAPVGPAFSDGENHAIVVRKEPSVISAGSYGDDSSNATVTGEHLQPAQGAR